MIGRLPTTDLGLKTLPLQMTGHCAGVMEMAGVFDCHPAITPGATTRPVAG